MLTDRLPKKPLKLVGGLWGIVYCTGGAVINTVAYPLTWSLSRICRVPKFVKDADIRRQKDMWEYSKQLIRDAYQ